MTTQLEQILNYLDRDGVTEVLITTGQPLQFRRGGTLVSITAAQLTRAQIAALISNTHLAPLLGQRTVADVAVGKRTVRVTASGPSEAPSLVIVRQDAARAPAPGTRPAPALAPANITERARRPSRLGRPVHDNRSPTIPPASTKPDPRTPDPIAHRPAPMPEPSRAPTPVPSRAPTPVPAPQTNRLTRSDIKFRAPAPPAHARGHDSIPLDLDPTGAEVELDPPSLDLARGGSLSLDLDDSGDAIELGAPGHHGSTPALDAGFAGPRPTHAGSTPAVDDAFSGPPRTAQRPRAPDLGLPVPGRPIDDGARISSAAPAVPAVSARSSVALPPALRALVQEAAAHRASDLHIIVNRPACVRVLGELRPMRPEVLGAPEVEALLLPLLDERGRAQLERVGYSDLALEGPDGTRLRTNIARCQGGLRGTFRLARGTPPTLDELSLPKELAKVVAHHQGLVVIAGPSGHGKTTTLAALVDLINSASAFHIITVEDPIEIVYPRKRAVVSQREVGAHTRSFAAALKGSLREDPDIIVIGELRDPETVEIALTAAETGHLVLATMSTPSAAKTIDRLVDMFPPDDQSQVRSSIAGALRAIVSQRLLPSAAGDGVVAAVELVTGVLPLAVLIRDDKLFQLPSLMMRGKAFGMIRLDDSLAELVRAGRITTETALANTDNRKELATRLSQGTAAIPTMGRK